jgi:hypothetical protein
MASVAAWALSRLWRALSATRAPRRDTEHGPIAGSLDTWPEVPRNTVAARPR